LIYADRYGVLRLYEASGRSQGVLQDVTPATLDHNAWIYATSVNVTAGRARGATGGVISLYRWPSGFISRNYDLVYANGTSEVFH